MKITKCYSSFGYYFSISLEKGTIIAGNEVILKHLLVKHFKLEQKASEKLVKQLLDNPFNQKIAV
jgi:hypothetical protein